MVDAAIAVHRRFGPGLLESVYEEALAIELAHRGVHVARQVAVDLEHRGQRLTAALRIDLVVGHVVVVEVKAVETLTRAHTSQLLTYLRLSGIRLGLLLNFHEVLLRDGIRRLVV